MSTGVQGCPSPYPSRFQYLFVCLVFLVVPEDWREASRVERRLVRVVVSSIVVTWVVAVGWVVAGVVVTRSQKGVAVIPVATEEVLALQKDDIYFNMREVIVTCNQYAIQF